MLLIVNSWYPTNKAMEVVKKYVEVMKKMPYPPYIKLLATGTRPVKEGIKSMEIHEVEQGRFEEARKHIARFLREFWNIEGFSYEYETLLTMAESFALVELTPP